MIPGVEAYQLVLAILIVVIGLATLSPRLRLSRSVLRWVRVTVLFVGLLWICMLYVWDGIGGYPQDPRLEVLRRPLTGEATVVIIHGWQGSTQSWSDLPRLLLKDERFGRMGVALVVYPTRLTGANRSIAQLAASAAALIAGDVPNGRLRILAHSLGGVISRQMIVDAPPAFARRITHLVTLGSPFGGTRAATLGPELGIEATVLDDLAPKSLFLEDLSERWRRALRAGLQLRHLCVAGKLDAVVAPASATRDCARSELWESWGHADLANPSRSREQRYMSPTTFLLE